MSKVSVIIPCYNQGKFIDRAIKSIVSQTFEDIETIVVDDGSTDPETIEILSRIDFPNIRVVRTKNQGLAAARNNGIQVAAGKYILPLDADDYIGSTYVEIAVRLLDNRPDLGIVYCRAQLFGSQNTEWNLPEFSLKEMLLDNIIFCTAFFRKRDWEHVGGYDSSMTHGWEDYDFWLSLIETGQSVFRIPRILFYYRVSENSMVRSRSINQKVETFTKIYHKHIHLFSDHISIWINTLLSAHDKYKQAWLSIRERGLDSKRADWFRKIDTGYYRLEFSLDKIETKYCFHISDDQVAIKKLKVQYQEEGRDKTVITKLDTNANLFYKGVYFFDTLRPKLFIDMEGLSNTENNDTKKRLVIELEYLHFGRECLCVALKNLSDATVEVKTKTNVNRDEKKQKRKRPVKSPPKSLVKIIGSKLKKTKQKHLLAIRKSGLFDEKFYLRSNPEIDFTNIDPLVHYIENGWREGRDPNELFDSLWYTKQNPDCNGIDPLLNYIESGWLSNKDPNLYFSTGYYRKQYPEFIKTCLNPLAHYLKYGWREGKNPNPDFDSNGYLAQYPDVKMAGMNPLTHYIHHGIQEGRQYLRFFDIDYYKERNPFIKLEPIYHYLNYGAEEGLWPNRFFDPKFYRNQYCQTDTSLLEAYLHFLKTGYKKGHRPWALFDPKFYSNTYPEYLKTHQFPLLHYQNEGVFKGYYPCREIEKLRIKPIISIITPVYKTDALLLKKCIHSVINQAYPHWELCLVDDGSNSKSICSILEKFRDIDKRIKVLLLNENKGISEASNTAAEMASGEFIAFLDHDDELTLNALYEVVKAINTEDPDVIYSDESLISYDGRHLDHFYKPDFNVELLMSHNYITHFLVTKRSLFKKVGGFSRMYDGAQDYDLILRLIEHSNKIAHIAKPIYQWRAIETSTSINHKQKDYADSAGRKALQSAFIRQKIEAFIYPGMMNYFYQVERKIVGQPTVDIFFILNEDDGDTKYRIEYLLERTKYSKIKMNFIILPRKKHLPMNLKEDINKFGKIHEFKKNKSLIQALNQAVAGTRGKHLVFLNSNVHITCSNWVEMLLGYSQDKEIGAVGGLIDFKSQNDLEISATPDLKNLSWQYYREFFLLCSRHLNGLHCAQDVLAISADFFMVKRSLFESAGGFVESELSDVMADIDLCLRLNELGVRNVYIPYCETVCKGKPFYQFVEQINASSEIKKFQKRWRPLLVKGDPFYNLNNILDGTKVTKEMWINWFCGTAVKR